MAAIRGSNTAPERRVAAALRNLGHRPRRNHENLPGRPDFVLPRAKVIIFVHGCFWHRHRGCKFTTTPTTRSRFWKAKFEANVARDRRVTAALRRTGWHVLTVWECATRDPGRLQRLISSRISRCLVRRRKSR
jgi:DNA mismatch endonuclease (patch repair protein)